MASVDIHRLAIAFASAVVFEDATLRLEKGWYGLVGANGAGKTTLLRAITRELAPRDGTVRVAPDDALVTLCPQTIGEPSDDVRAFADATGRDAELRARLAVDPEGLARWPTLSPGERKRWQIGAALARDPDVLLLDEPTNHLDHGARALLVAALRRFRGVGVVVSHDRDLLDELTTSTVRVHDARITLFRGSFSVAKEAWTAARRAAEDEHHTAKRAAAHVAARLDRAQRERASADASRSSRSRMKDKNDHDGREFGRKALATWAEAKAGRNVSVLRDALDRAERDVPALTRDRTLGAKVFARFERAPSPILFHLDAPVIVRGGRTILEDVRITIARDDRVRIHGPNGAGKTTLLEALLATRRPERILWLPQEPSLEAIANDARTLRSLDPETRSRVVSIFAALGSDPERLVFRDDASLSPGEAKKLSLALALGQHAWALVLDEPTNHLDLPSAVRLEDALASYPGAIVLVTHDDRFAAACTNRTIDLQRSFRPTASNALTSVFAAGDSR